MGYNGAVLSPLPQRPAGARFFCCPVPMQAHSSSACRGRGPAAGALPRLYHDLGLPRRLHRRVGMGDNGFQDEAGATELHKVFLAYSFDVQDAIETGEVVVVV